jgi:hypothetical protein
VLPWLIATLIELSVGCTQPCATSHSGPVRGGALRQLQLDEVVARDPLVRAAAGEVEVAPVARAQGVRRVGAAVVPRGCELPDRPRHRDREGWRRDREALVHEDLRPVRMVDDEQRQQVEEVRLPQLRRDAQVVGAVVRGQLVAADLHPVLGRRRVRRHLRVDAQPQRRAPDEVGHEAHLAAVPREQPRARALEALAGRDHGTAAALNSDCRIPFGQTIRTTSPASPRPGRSARRRVDRALLQVQAARSSTAPPMPNELMRWSPVAVAERGRSAATVSLGAAHGRARGPAVGCDPDDLQAAVPVEVRGRQRREAERRRQRLEGTGGAAEQHARRALARDDQVGGTVVVEVRDQQVRRGSGVGNPRDGRLLPGAAVGRASPADDGAVGADPHDVERRALARDGGDRGQSGRRGGLLAEQPAALVDQGARAPAGVEERRVRDAVAVDVGPDEPADVLRFAERTQLGERAVAVVAQHDRGAETAAITASRSPSVSTSAAQAPNARSAAIAAGRRPLTSPRAPPSSRCSRRTPPSPASSRSVR